jgi:hypothetical protein
VRTRGTRRRIVIVATAALVVVAAACSSGGNGEQRVSTDAHASTSIAAPSPTTARRHRPATHATSATIAPRRGSAAVAPTTVAVAGRAGGATTVTVGVAPPVVTTPLTPAPTTPKTSPPLPPPPTTPPGPKPYDPTKPIDLSGTPGVTPAEQARAEQLIRDTLRDTKKYESPQAAYADGYRSIGDAATGDEHYVKWAYANDGHILDSKRPESLVYERKNGKQFLAAAMYSLPPGSGFADVPDVGGPLTQWHVHNDLCLADSPADPLQKVVSSITGVNGKCPPGSSKLGSAPMLHVWVIANKCGPFAALEGIGAGQIPPGQTRLCDTAHGG